VPRVGALLLTGGGGGGGAGGVLLAYWDRLLFRSDLCFIQIVYIALAFACALADFSQREPSSMKLSFEERVSDSGL